METNTSTTYIAYQWKKNTIAYVYLLFWSWISVPLIINAGNVHPGTLPLAVVLMKWHKGHSRIWRISSSFSASALLASFLHVLSLARAHVAGRRRLIGQKKPARNRINTACSCDLIAFPLKSMAHKIVLRHTKVAPVPFPKSHCVALMWMGTIHINVISIVILFCTTQVTSEITLVWTRHKSPKRKISTSKIILILCPWQNNYL